ncbi:transposase [Rhodococcus qingshengii]|uniref:transposase n=1 Tax=Rhodococcus qingshengii TaxID=334542 RepID=UPI001ADF1675|nr:transposase [Rhodococcus qingshengii]
MSSPNPISTPENSVDPAPKPTRRTFTAEYRNKILDEYNQAPYGEKSAVLRREGLYQSQLREWSGTRGSKRPAKVKSEKHQGTQQH